MQQNLYSQMFQQDLYSQMSPYQHIPRHLEDKSLHNLESKIWTFGIIAMDLNYFHNLLQYVQQPN